MALRHRESGAVALLFAALAVLLLVMAALSVDIGMQINRKHQLWATLDSAAQSGASELPGSTSAAKTTALKFALSHDATATGGNTPNVDFWCITASTPVGTTYAVDTTQIPSTCNPGPSPWTVGALYRSTNRKTTCSAILCAIPCVEPVPNTGTPKIACNTIRVFQGRDVPFAFGPAGGIDKGNTGALVSVACKGSCGTVAPNPMDVAIIADRTLSMDADDVADMITGIKGVLEQMTPSQQYVALGAIGRSRATSTGQSGSCGNSDTGLTYPSGSGASGQWLPISFSNNYATSKGVLATNSTLIKAVNCVSNQSAAGQGTSLAAPVKASSRYLLGLTSNNLSSLPTRPVAATKVLILETDGQPNETQPSAGSTSLTTTGDIFSNREDRSTTYTTSTRPDTSVTDRYGVTTITHNKTITYQYVGGQKACDNLQAVAADAKARGVLVITIAYNMTGKRCGDYDGGGQSNSSTSTVQGPERDTNTRKYQTTTTTVYQRNTGATSTVLNVLAATASPSNGVASTAGNDCSTTALRATENADGDYFFCAASGSDMTSIFTTALSQASSGIKLLNLP
jgi:hypothetical protein